MPKEAPKQKVQPKELTPESLKAQKSEAVKKFKKFDDYAKKYGSMQSIQETLAPTGLDIQDLSKKPQYKEIFNNLISLTHNGIGSLHFLRGMRIKKGLNLLKLKAKLSKLTQNLKTTLSEWRKTNTKLERAVDLEKKRGELFGKLCDNADGYIFDNYKDLSHESYLRTTKILENNPVYKDLLEKLKKASPDEINAMYRDEEPFKKMREYTKKLMSFEGKREALLLDLKESPSAIASENPLLIGSEQVLAAEYAIKQSGLYNKMLHILNTADVDRMENIGTLQEVSDVYTRYFETIAYQYGNEERLDDALKPYLKLKPKGISEDKFLAALRNSTYYNKAFDAIQKGSLEEQKAFEPTAYLNFNAEEAVYIAAANGAADNLYSFAKILAENMVKIKERKLPEDYNFA